MESLSKLDTNLARCYNSLGNCYYGLNRPDKALEFYNKALKMREELSGSDYHFDMPVYKNQIGTVYEDKGEYHEAVKCYKDALEILKELKLTGYVDEAVFRRNLANVYVRLKKFTEAEEEAEKAYNIRQKVLGNHPDTVRSIFQRGVIQANFRAFKKALDFFLQAWEMEKILGAGNQSAVWRRIIKGVFDMCDFLKNKNSEKKKFRQDALDFCQRFWKDEKASPQFGFTAYNKEIIDCILYLLREKPIMHRMTDKKERALIDEYEREAIWFYDGMEKVTDEDFNNEFDSSKDNKVLNEILRSRTELLDRLIEFCGRRDKHDQLLKYKRDKLMLLKKVLVRSDFVGDKKQEKLSLKKAVETLYKDIGEERSIKAFRESLLATWQQQWEEGKDAEETKEKLVAKEKMMKGILQLCKELKMKDLRKRYGKEALSFGERLWEMRHSEMELSVKKELLNELKDLGSSIGDRESVKVYCDALQDLKDRKQTRATLRPKEKKPVLEEIPSSAGVVEEEIVVEAEDDVKAVSVQATETESQRLLTEESSGDAEVISVQAEEEVQVESEDEIERDDVESEEDSEEESNEGLLKGTVKQLFKDAEESSIEWEDVKGAEKTKSESEIINELNDALRTSDTHRQKERTSNTYRQKAPSEILARGPLATEAYQTALLEGKGYSRRVPVMIIGQHRAGKTSLKRSLKGQRFNRDERSTKGIETDPSYFKVSTDVWRTSKINEDTEPEPTFSFEYQTAQSIVETIKKEIPDDLSRNPSGSGTNSSKSHQSRSNKHQAAQLIRDSFKKGNTDNSSTEELSSNPSNSETEPSKVVKKTKELLDEMSSIMTERSPQDSELVENARADLEPAEESSTEGIDASLQDSQDHLRGPNLPDDIAVLVQRLLENNKEVENEDDIYSIVWDFGGQSVYYVTHPIFLTKRAIYILTCDLSRDPYQTDNAPFKSGMGGNVQDTYCIKTPLDYLNFWMSSVYSLVNPEFAGLPPVFLVCTHADKPYRSDDLGDLAREVYDVLKKKPYGKLLKGFFVVDNTKSGSKSECQGVIKLRNKVLSVAKELPQMNEPIPLKWLKFEKVLRLLCEEGYKWIPFEEARKISLDECGIKDDKQLSTLLDFLHDQRVLIHFNETPELKNMVILSPQWLIDVFKEVITVKRWEQVEENFVELWGDLEEKGILDKKLLDHVWRPFFDGRENCESLIAIMERFSLLCSWPSDDTTEKYLVPSMLKSPPTDDVLEHLASVKTPSLFVRFKSRRVPAGLFSRLVVLFYQLYPTTPQLFANFALFHIPPLYATSVILLCHSSSIEIIFYVSHAASAQETGVHNESNLTATRDIHQQLTLFLECMREKFFWLKHMRYEMCVSCPVCSLQEGASECRKHKVRGCDCLHLLSEREILKGYCEEASDIVRADISICKEMFVAWFAFSDEHESRISLIEREDISARNQSEKHCAVSAGDQSPSDDVNEDDGHKSCHGDDDEDSSNNDGGDGDSNDAGDNDGEDGNDFDMGSAGENETTEEELPQQIHEVIQEGSVEDMDAPDSDKIRIHRLLDDDRKSDNRPIISEVDLVNNQDLARVEFYNASKPAGNASLFCQLHVPMPSQNASSITDHARSYAGRPLRVISVGDEWGSSKGGLSTLNRELAKHLAQQPDIEVTFLLPGYGDIEKQEASDCNVSLAKPKSMYGLNRITMLSFPPDDLDIDVVIGHGQKLGAPAQAIAKQRNCKRVHFVHTASEELAIFKKKDKAIPEGEEKHRVEVGLCEEADIIVAIGPKLAEATSANMRPYGKDEHIINITPGIFSEFTKRKQASKENEKFRILVFGRGDLEDFDLKGYDIAARAVKSLKDQTYLLIFVGAPEGEEDKVKDNLLKCGISGNQLCVRGFIDSRENLEKLFCEVDLALMPSRTEGFGLTALEALSAGLPILASENSGFGRALQPLSFGDSVVVGSDDADKWGEAIKKMRKKPRKTRLDEARSLRQSYANEYKWEAQCKILVEKMQSLFI